MNIIYRYLRDLCESTLSGWNRFWFTPADPATLGLIRLLGGTMIFYTHLVWTIDLEGFFGPAARISTESARTFHNHHPYAWSYLFQIESAATLWTVHIAALVILAMFAAGLFTRVTSILAFLITVAYANRVPTAQFGLDHINGLLALYLMIGPGGAALSLDSLLKRWAAKMRNAPAHSGGFRNVPQASTSANIAIRLIQIHLCIIYLFAGFGKLLGSSWWDGQAMWIVLANYEYQSLDMTWLADYPLAISFLTHMTIVWECSYVALVWPRLTRPLVIALAIPLHLGIAICMGMKTFGLVMLIGNLAFVSPQLVRMAVSSLSRKRVQARLEARWAVPASGDVSAWPTRRHLRPEPVDAF